MEPIRRLIRYWFSPLTRRYVLFIGRGLVGWPIVALLAVGVFAVVDGSDASQELFASIVFIALMLIPVGIVAVLAAKDDELDHATAGMVPTAQSRAAAVLGAAVIFVGLAIAVWAFLIGISVRG